jgi:hypothetical protein
MILIENCQAGKPRPLPQQVRKKGLARPPRLSNSQSTSPQPYTSVRMGTATVIEYISSDTIFITPPVLSATASLGAHSGAKSSGNLDVHHYTAPYGPVGITGAQILFTTSIIEKMGYQASQGSQGNPRVQCTRGGAC